ncbi:uncharacterized protein LOC142228708 [Haematobia irritans]|uniref:uncharacterized protein LOC142228708 n=1 Tax=Haematobia irritans TaxID=7368 RepID=UPI003F4FE3FD
METEEFEIIPNLSSVCRTCLEADGKYYQIYDYVDDNHRILEMLDELFPQIKFKEDVGDFPPLICEICVDKLITSYQFHSLCLEADSQLRQIILEGVSVTTRDDLNEDDEMKSESVDVDDTTQNEDAILTVKNEIVIPMKILQPHEEPYLCSDCGEYFDNLAHLNSHVCPYAKIVLYQCNLCRRTFKNEEGYQIHLDEDHKDNSICVELYENNELQIREHISEVLESPSGEDRVEFEDIYGIEVDGLNEEDWNDNKTMTESEETFLNSNETGNDDLDPGKEENDEYVGEIEKTDMKNVRNGNYPCDVCGKVFDRISRFNRHSRVHSLHKPYACEICKRRFSTIHYLKVHEAMHSKKQLEDSSQTPAGGFKCPHCPRRFENKNALSGHRRMHADKTILPNFLCVVCGRKFLTMKTLTDHVRNQHPNADKYPCEKCDKTFIVKEQLLDHASKHRDKDLVCSICNKEFAFECFLREHMRSHTGECPYLCPECGKGFKCAGNLRQHRERHSTIKKYQCPLCPMRFKCRADVKKHKTTHQGLGRGSIQSRRQASEKNFIHNCGLCDLSFDTASQLRRHSQTHLDNSN